MGNNIANDLGIKHLSYSSVALWNRCPREWWLKYVHKVTETVGPALAFGTAMHQTIQQSLLGKGVGVEGAGKFHSAMQAAVVSSKLMASPADVKNLTTLGRQILADPMVAAILDSIKVSSADQVERRVEFYVPNVDIPIIGYIDIMDDDGHPYDIKTSKWDWTDERAEAEDQPDFYLTALDLLNDTRHGGKFSHIIITKNGDAPSAYILDSTRVNYTNKVFNMVQTMWRGMGNHMWTEKIVREACATCKVRFECYHKK